MASNREDSPTGHSYETIDEITAPQIQAGPRRNSRVGIGRTPIRQSRSNKAPAEEAKPTAPSAPSVPPAKPTHLSLKSQGRQRSFRPSLRIQRDGPRAASPVSSEEEPDYLIPVNLETGHAWPDDRESSSAAGKQHKQHHQQQQQQQQQQQHHQQQQQQQQQQGPPPPTRAAAAAPPPRREAARQPSPQVPRRVSRPSLGVQGRQRSHSDPYRKDASPPSPQPLPTASSPTPTARQPRDKLPTPPPPQGRRLSSEAVSAPPVARSELLASAPTQQAGPPPPVRPKETFLQSASKSGSTVQACQTSSEALGSSSSPRLGARVQDPTLSSKTSVAVSVTEDHPFRAEIEDLLKNNPFAIELPQAQPQELPGKVPQKGRHAYEFLDADGNELPSESTTDEPVFGFAREDSRQSRVGFGEEVDTEGTHASDAHGYAIHALSTRGRDVVVESEDELDAFSAEKEKRGSELFKNNPFLDLGQSADSRILRGGLSPPVQPLLMRQRSHSESDVRVLNSNAESVAQTKPTPLNGTGSPRSRRAAGESDHAHSRRKAYENLDEHGVPLGRHAYENVDDLGNPLGKAHAYENVDEFGNLIILDEDKGLVSFDGDEYVVDDLPLFRELSAEQQHGMLQGALREASANKSFSSSFRRKAKAHELLEKRAVAAQPSIDENVTAPYHSQLTDAAPVYPGIAEESRSAPPQHAPAASVTSSTSTHASDYQVRRPKPPLRRSKGSIFEESAEKEVLAWQQHQQHQSPQQSQPQSQPHLQQRPHSTAVHSAGASAAMKRRPQTEGFTIARSAPAQPNNGPENYEMAEPEPRRLSVSLVKKMKQVKDFVARGGKKVQTSSHTHEEQTESWYHGSLSRQQTEDTLRAHGSTQGLFLLRDSSLGGNTLVVSVCYGTVVIHNKIERTTKGEYIYMGVGKTFTSVSDLIRNYMEVPDSKGRRLREWVRRK